MDYYSMLGLTLESTEKDIRRAFRKKAIKYHPDKNKAESAKKMFMDLSKAYEVLTDAKARAAYDKIKRAEIAKRERDDKMHASRRKLKGDLERREFEAAEAKRFKSCGESRDEKELQREIERLRREGHSRIQKEYDWLKEELKKSEDLQRSASPAPAPATTPASATATAPVSSSSTSYPLKVRWKPKRKDYDLSEIEKIMKSHGEVKHILPSKKKGMVIVEFEDTSNAIKAVKSSSEVLTVTWINGCPPDPLLGVPNINSAELESHCKQRQQLHSEMSFDEFEARTLLKMRQSQDIVKLQEGGTASLSSMFESPAALKLRRKEERDRLTKQLLEEDELESNL